MLFVQLLPWAILIGLFCLVWAILDRFTRKPATGAERLETLRDFPTSDEQVLTGRKTQLDELLDKAVPKLSKPFQSENTADRQKVKFRLANAGFNSSRAGEIFLAMKCTLMIAGGLIGIGVGLVSWGFNLTCLTSIIVGIAFGMFLPELILKFLTKSRQKAIFYTLPDAIDLMVIAVEVGQGLDVAMREVVKEMAETAPEVCQEFGLYNFQVQMGRARAEALHDLGLRSGVDSMNSLSTVLIQSERFGTSIASSLRDLSDTMRVKRRQFAEELAQKTAVKLLFPLVLFIFPGIFVVLVGPAAITMINDMLTM